MATTASTALERDLKALLGEDAVLPGNTRAYLSDATESRNLRGRADAIALPNERRSSRKRPWPGATTTTSRSSPAAAARASPAAPSRSMAAWSSSLENLKKIRHLDPGLWRAAVEAGVVTADLRRRARENGLLYPPDPGSHEQSQIGGNIATNAGGPHAFKYGVTGAWITGLEFVLAPGELVRVGGPIRKDVAGYDLKSLMIGSEGTLGIVTAAWVKMIPAPEAALPLAALYPDTATGCAAIEAAFASGVVPAAIEYLDEGAIEATRGAFPVELPDDARFMVIVDADGTADRGGPHPQRADRGAERGRAARSTRPPPPTRSTRCGAGATAPRSPSPRSAAARSRRTSSSRSTASQEAIDATIEIGRRHDLPACSWGHAGDGNLHSTFMIDLDDPAELERAEHAAEDLFALAVELGGSVSGEHGIGLVKNGQIAAPVGSRRRSRCTRRSSARSTPRAC